MCFARRRALSPEPHYRIKLGRKNPEQNQNNFCQLGTFVLTVIKAMPPFSSVNLINKNWDISPAMFLSPRLMQPTTDRPINESGV
jgi:hypothetical protein